MTLNRNDVYYCATECARQKSGEMSVYRMVSALEYIRAWKIVSQTDGPTVPLIRTLAEEVEPLHNRGGRFRCVPVIVNGTRVGFDHVEERLHRLLDMAMRIEPVEFYKEFEVIHPFVDGNGRVGSLLFNLVNGTLHRPMAPPDVFAKDDSKEC